MLIDYVEMPVLLCLLIFLINYSKHPFDELITAVMTFASTHFGVVRAVYYGLYDAVA